MQRHLRRILQHFGSSEAAILVSLALIVSGIWAFVELADEVIEADTMDFDQRLLQTLQYPNDDSRLVGSPWLQDTAQDMTALGS